MLTTPTWLAATAGSRPLAGQVNQFLVSHATTYVWSGTLRANQVTAGSGSASSVNQYIAQSFTTASGQTATGYVLVSASVAGTPPPWTFSIQASASGAPSGTPLASTPVPHEFVPATAGGVAVILPVSGLTASATYWLVASPAGGHASAFTWTGSNQSSGCSLSPDGVTWAPQPFGMVYAVYDATPLPPLAGTWEDSGARWSVCAYASVPGKLATVSEFTTGQDGGYAASSRALSYSGALLTGVA